MTSRPYAAAQVAFATMHGKDRLARQPFRDILGADVFATPDLDTDQFGTFAGDIPRILKPVEAARVKARLGMHIAGTPYGLASEGSFSATLGIWVEHYELLIFTDATRGLELVESSVATSALPASRRVTSADDAVAFAAGIGFPVQGVVLTGGTAGERIYRSLTSVGALIETMEDLISTSDGQVVIAPDYRSHRCPSRAEVIADLARRMAVRLATPCPACYTPGFGKVNIETGLNCGDCGEPTTAIAADILGCGQCSHTVRRPRADRWASAEWCDSCNP